MSIFENSKLNAQAAKAPHLCADNLIRANLQWQQEQHTMETAVSDD